MKNVKIILVLLVLLASATFLLSIFAYQRVINEGSVIADNECLIVNPLIIERKNSYLASVEIFKTGNGKAYVEETNNYLAISKKYVAAQEAWLKDQRTFMDRRDYQVLFPSYAKEASIAQYVSRAADVQATQALIKYVETKDPELKKKYIQTLIDQMKNSKVADEEYGRIWDLPKKFDFRTQFIKVPESKCPPENFNIPDIPDLLNPNTIPTDSNQPLS